MTRYFLSALLVLAAALPRPADAQGLGQALEAVPLDSRVRLSGPEMASRRVVGRITAVTGDSVFISRGEAVVGVALADVWRADVSQGRNHFRGIRRGVLVTAAVVGGLNGVFVYAGHPECGDSCLPGGDLDSALLGAWFGALISVPAGAVIGYIVGVEEWKPLHRGYDVRVVPIPDGRLGIGLSLRVP